jgi:hypothetical protein
MAQVERKINPPMTLMFKIVLGLLFIASAAQAKIGWTYEECVAHWGHETDHIILHKEIEYHDWLEVPLFIFHYGKRYVTVQFSVIDQSFSYKDSKVLSELISDDSGF